ncbi:MAG TPA: hypothetical protein VJH23_06480 [archaeon]|nr:hypothetical protein [archaeon]
MASNLNLGHIGKVLERLGLKLEKAAKKQRPSKKKSKKKKKR